MPPEVIREVLWTAFGLPGATDTEVVRVERKDTTRPLAIWRTERADVDGIGSAVDGVWSAVSRARRHFFRRDDLHQRWLARIGLGVEDVKARGAQAWHEQVTPLHVGVGF